MNERSPQEDERAAEPPSSDAPESEPAEGSDGPAATEEPGPLGNPEVDEEGLANRQQDSDD
jgi:hypothetical protein